LFSLTCAKASLRRCQSAAFGCWLVLVAGSSCENSAAPRTKGGDIVWHASGEGWGGTTFDASSAYFVGLNHELVAVDKISGRIRWHGHESDPGPNTNGLSVVIAGDIVALGDLDIHAFDRATGIHRWDFQPAEGFDPGLYYLETDGQTIFAGSPSGHVYAVEAATGKQRWITAVAADGHSGTFSPVLDRGVLFVCLKHFTVPTTSGGVVAMDAATGSVLWSRDLPPNPPYGGAACDLKVVVSGDLVITASDAGKIYALDRTTGDIRWNAPQLSGLPPNTGGSPDADVRPLVASRGLVVAGSTTGYVTAYDAATGTERWRNTANRGSASYPLSADSEAVYVTHSGLQLASFDLTTGALRWLAGDNPGGGEFFPSPVADRDRIYVSGIQGFYALHK
jgi:eukaryotic-like serine/threonine-protein kinase